MLLPDPGLDVPIEGDKESCALPPATESPSRGAAFLPLPFNVSTSASFLRLGAALPGILPW